MPNPSAAFDHLLSCARILVPHVPAIEAAPATLEGLQKDLVILNARITSARNALATVKSEWAEEWKLARSARDLTAESNALVLRDLEAEVEEARDELRRAQTAIAASMRKAEKLAKALRRLEGVGAIGRGAALAELVEAMR